MVKIYTTPNQKSWLRQWLCCCRCDQVYKLLTLLSWSSAAVSPLSLMNIPLSCTAPTSSLRSTPPSRDSRWVSTPPSVRCLYYCSTTFCRTQRNHRRRHPPQHQHHRPNDDNKSIIKYREGSRPKYIWGPAAPLSSSIPLSNQSSLWYCHNDDCCIVINYRLIVVCDHLTACYLNGNHWCGGCSLFQLFAILFIISCLNCTKFGKLVLRKIIEITTICHILKLKCTKFNFGWGSAQTPLGEHTAPPWPLAGFKGASRKEGREGEERVNIAWPNL